MMNAATIFVQERTCNLIYLNINIWEVREIVELWSSELLLHLIFPLQSHICGHESYHSGSFSCLQEIFPTFEYKLSLACRHMIHI